MVDLTNIDQYIAKHLRDTELYTKLQEMMLFVVSNSNIEIGDVKDKYTNPANLSDEAIRQIMLEQGYDYIVGLMDTITGFRFDTMVSFMDLIDQLKGTRPGLELVLKLLGFDSIIREWWEDPLNLGEPLTYEITVFVNSSFVPDIFSTLKKVQIFSDNYVLASISNVDVQFLFDRFASKSPIMGGFVKQKFVGQIIQRAV